jgi:hypothetical protein
MAADLSLIEEALAKAKASRGGGEEVTAMPDVAEEGDEEEARIGFADEDEDEDDLSIGETPAADAETPADVADAAPVEDLDALRSRAQQAADLERFIQDSPDAAAAYILGKMTPQQQQAFMAAQGLGRAQVQAADVPLTYGDLTIGANEYAEMTQAEQLAWKNGNFISTGEARLTQMDTGIRQAFQQQNQVLQYREYQHAIMEQKLNTALRLLGVELPDVDQAEVETALAQTKDVRKAVEQTYGKKLSAVQQIAARKGVARPRTPGNAGNGGSPSGLGKNASLLDIMKAEQAFRQQYGRAPRANEI